MQGRGRAGRLDRGRPGPGARSLIRHFASCFISAIYEVFDKYNTSWSIFNAFSLLICKIKEGGRMRVAGFHGLKKLQHRYIFRTSPNGMKFHTKLF